ncbi:MAG: 4-(cytidine 5'-diphospho)-2-C-methyl-D-erythritol kinase [Phycisphaerae bacterium]|nr:4-(cytidine 5'-diphospho)-2-C-methyl-D-erythritol kinase [Phycisphaerae bacterium]
MSTITCPAKLNLTLAVGPRRPDGYHDLESLVVPITLCDELSFEPRDPDPRVPRFTLTCDDPTIPVDATNLVLRAATALDAALSEPRPLGGVLRRDPARSLLFGGHFTLKKRIPAGAGLGGGSSNAAGALKLLAQEAVYSPSALELHAIAARIGSDVPLFLADSPVIMRGRGEQLTAVRLPGGGFAVVVLPQIHCSTAAVYAAFDALPPPPARPRINDVLARAKSLEDLMPLGFNDLVEPAFRVAPPLRELHHQLQQFAPFRLTGSGSALFTLVGNRPRATDLAARVRSALSVRVEPAALFP